MTDARRCEAHNLSLAWEDLSSDDRRALTELLVEEIVARPTKAGVTATIPLDDGSTEFVNVAWDGTNAPLRVSGTNGPFNVDIARHVVNRCITANNNSHQQYRSGVRVTGTIDGTDVDHARRTSSGPAA